MHGDQAPSPEEIAIDLLRDKVRQLQAELAGAVALAGANRRDLEARQAGHARLLDAIAAQLGTTGLELAENPAAAGRALAEVREKHDTLKGLLESYKAQWKAHYARELDERKRELDVDFAKRRDDYLDDKVAEAREDEREICARLAEARIVPPHQGGGTALEHSNLTAQHIAAAIRARGGS